MLLLVSNIQIRTFNRSLRAWVGVGVGEMEIANAKVHSFYYVGAGKMGGS